MGFIKISDILWNQFHQSEEVIISWIIQSNYLVFEFGLWLKCDICSILCDVSLEWMLQKKKLGGHVFHVIGCNNQDYFWSCPFLYVLTSLILTLAVMGELQPTGHMQLMVFPWMTYLRLQFFIKKIFLLKREKNQLFPNFKMYGFL